ncbi:MAG: DUF3780 domain-containing protein [Aminivibrio sp.]|jgi:hypothetical protein
MTAPYYGFGYSPSRSDNHFYVIIPKETAGEVEVYERFHWDEGEQKITARDILKLRLSRHKWAKLSRDVAAEFNARLRAEKKPSSRFLVGETPVEKQFGKELMVLLWAIENNDPSGIPIAIRNWKGLLPEERWWLYTMTNASTGKINDRRGWRMALRYALCENPVNESGQMALFLDQEEGE